jgi:hypothetical protein
MGAFPARKAGYLTFMTLLPDDNSLEEEDEPEPERAMCERKVMRIGEYTIASCNVGASVA